MNESAQLRLATNATAEAAAAMELFLKEITIVRGERFGPRFADGFARLERKSSNAAK